MGTVAKGTPKFDADSAVAAKRATMAKSEIMEKGHLGMETSYFLLGLDFGKTTRSAFWGIVGLVVKTL
jgi:hypothetical protein